MKVLRLTFSSILLIVLNSCLDEQPDCVCTTEFRMYLVTVIDTLGNPVDSLQIEVTNSQGKEYTFEGLSQPPYLYGAYFLMTDGYVNEFSTNPEKIIFKGSKDNQDITAEFFFNTDDCNCHVYKVSGADTLIFK